MDTSFSQSQGNPIIHNAKEGCRPTTSVIERSSGEFAHKSRATRSLKPFAPSVARPHARKKSFDSLAPMVGNGEKSGASLRCAGVGCVKHSPFRIVPEVGQVSENVSESDSQVICDVFQDDVTRSHLANDSRELGPEVSRIIGSLAVSRSAKRLAWIPAADHVSGLQVVSADSPHVIVTHSVGPVLGEHLTAERVALHLPHGVADARPFEAKLQASDS